MKRYTGTYKNKDESTTTVIITPSAGGWDGEVELKFPFDEPVIITQNSEGIYSPIKTKSCTIKIWTDDIYWDLYTSNPTAYLVGIAVDGVGVFKGYLTPCVYSQDYAYKGEIELEAVDILAVTSEFKYTLINNGTDKEILSVDSIIRNELVRTIPNFSSNHFVPQLRNIDLTDYYLQESNFFDDDNEPMTVKEVLEEIAKYFGATFYSTDNGRINLVEYDYLKDIAGTIETLDTKKYGTGTPSVELDSVYTNIEVNDNLYEIEGSDLMYDFFDEDRNNELINAMKYCTSTSESVSTQIYCDYSYSWRETYKHTTDANKGKILIKPYYFVDDTLDLSSPYNTGKWKTPLHMIINGEERSSASLTVRKAAEFKKDEEDNIQWYPYFTSAYPTKVIEYNQEEGMADNPSWDNIIVFPAMNYTYFENNIKDKVITNSYGAATSINFDTTALEYEALKYISDEFIPYSIQDGTSWIVFNGKLWYQRNYTTKTDPDTWGSNDTNNVEVWKGDNKPLPFPFYNITYNTKYLTEKYRQTYSHDKDNANHNKGWNCLKAKLKIGNKYFNGFEWNTTTKKYDSLGWGTTETTFYIPFHDEEVSKNETEYVSTFKWLEPVNNTDYTDKLDGDGLAIPITATDKVSGKLEFTLYTPKQLTTNPDDNSTSIPVRFNNNNKVLPANCWGFFYPNIYMKEFSLEYKYTDSTNWADDTESVEDIIYYKTDVANLNYSRIKDDLQLKINSWYEKKPISKSYILDSDNIPIKNIGSQPQEANLVDKYYAHYGTPKKILNLNYKEVANPSTVKHHNATNTDYVVDSFEYDVKAATTKYKFIEL